MTSLVSTTSAAPLAPIDEPRDLAAMTDAEFERGLERLELRKLRMHRILETALVDGAHFGNPKLANGTLAFKKPILFLAGAEELATSFRLQIATVDGQADQVVATAEYASVTVHRAILDGAGRVLDRTTASCSTKERRFKRQDGKGFTFSDAREVLNDLHAMAEKRAKVRLVRSALGITAFLASEEEMDADLQPDRPITPWTDEEKRAVYEVAQQKGLGRRLFAQLTQRTLGRSTVGTGVDVEKLLSALAALPEPTGGPAPTPSDTASDATPSAVPPSP